MNTQFNHFDTYIKTIADEKLAGAIQVTSHKFQVDILEDFNYASQLQCLMYGDVQSGKTSHVLGVIAKALDEGFKYVVFLTSDNTLLVEQTFDRVFDALPNVEVCSSKDERRFRNSASSTSRRDKPVIVVLNKHQSVLKDWNNYFTTTDEMHGLPLLIVDDEADAASLDNNVNKRGADRTQINRHLTKMRSRSVACIYLQVTGTPQAVLLQAAADGWRPDTVFSFDPGDKYVGGRNLFEEIPNLHVTSFRDTEVESFENLKKAVYTHIVTSAILLGRGDKACNMLVHPSRNQDDHALFAKDISAFIAELKGQLSDGSIPTPILEVWEKDLKPLNGANYSANELCSLVREFVLNKEIGVYIFNSRKNSDKNSANEKPAIDFGCNIIVGGDTLGRGLTIPALQTVFYSRVSKAPQADTLWQHARMFGYDRRLEYMRIFMPGVVHKTFVEVHKGNEAIKRQLAAKRSVDDFAIDLAPGLNPTRKTVVNKKHLRTLAGGVNYYPDNPRVSNFLELDALIDKFSVDEDTSTAACDVMVSLKSALTILNNFVCDEDDFPLRSFIGIFESAYKEDPSAKCMLLIRRNRKVQQGTGTLLSQSDRESGEEYRQIAVLTLYRIEGEFGWSSSPIWVPNLKLAGENIYYSISEFEGD